MQEGKASELSHSLTNGSVPKPLSHRARGSDLDRIKSGELSSSAQFGSPASLPNGNSDEIAAHK